MVPLLKRSLRFLPRREALLQLLHGAAEPHTQQSQKDNRDEKFVGRQSAGVSNQERAHAGYGGEHLRRDDADESAPYGESNPGHDER